MTLSRVSTVASRRGVPLLLALLATAAAGCRWTTRPPCVVVLGVDALHLPLLDKLVKDGVLPNFGRLYREGSVGPVSTRAAGLPPLSPLIWTSFATGRLPADHGIDRFVRLDEHGALVPVSSRDRRVAALWEIASMAGKRAGVVNWWATYPVERINGFMVSDRFLQRPSMFVHDHGPDSPTPGEAAIHPPELARTLGALRLPDRRGMTTLQVAEVIDRAVFRAAFAAWEQYPVDLLMIYTRALDELSHMTWWTHEPLPGEQPPADSVVQYMRRYDTLLGELLDRLGPRDHLVVLSDHGIERNPVRGQLSGQHASARVANGVQIWWGPGVKAGVRRTSAMVDIAPTVLELLGIPPPLDMRGEVLWFLFEPDHVFLARRREPYPRQLDSTTGSDRSPVDQEIVDQLRALGYVQ